MVAESVRKLVSQVLRAGGRLRQDRNLLPPTSRPEFLARVSSGETALEIGPFDRPQLRGTAVSYIDVLDTSALRRRAAELGRDVSGVPEIRYVSPNGDLAAVTEVFDVVLSCHAVEHQPDLVSHLKGVASVLRPGGRYMLIIPDKRYTFDHYLAETTTGDVVTAHSERRLVHTPDSVMAHHLQTTHNRGIRHWIGLHGRPADSPEQIEHARQAAARAAAGEYVDVHAWIFSPGRFRSVIAELREKALIPFSGVEVHETDFLKAEFFAVLTR